jgi:hypothetical protein
MHRSGCISEGAATDLATRRLAGGMQAEPHRHTHGSRAALSAVGREGAGGVGLEALWWRQRRREVQQPLPRRWPGGRRGIILIALPPQVTGNRLLMLTA